ncbi:protocadherin gamma-C5-like [Heteronotia binoei]|uniref:protocadherin gamma-C5-like n=1 Tax=Heteronotia binoei TaxID=13085 RepID=UPI002930E224|nr:protocadherin gamma-C5-like [Heteronotia binoei]
MREVNTDHSSPFSLRYFIFLPDRRCILQGLKEILSAINSSWFAVLLLPAVDIRKMFRTENSAWRLGLLHAFSFWLLLSGSSAQIRYSVPEELTRGSFVGNVAKDLGMDVAKLAAANLQVLSDSDSQYFSVNVNTGIIIVNDRIDREQLCGQNLRCFLHLKLAIENPVEFYRIEVEILDINDNAPEFSSSTIALQVYELAALGARFPVPHAQDLDVGTNTLQTYHLSANENFNLNVKARTDGTKFPELVLENVLDREHIAVHHLVLTAEDGGSPPRSSTIQIAVHVLDANDNHPVFDKPTYHTRLVENSPLGTLVIKLNATDRDEGPNGEIRYSLSSHNSEILRKTFAIDNTTGEIRVQGNLDFEEASVYEIEVEAKDMGSPTMEEHCSVMVEVVDVNDNPPEVVLTSFSSSINEDAPPGTVVAVIHVKDRDSGDQGKVHCDLPRNLPFKLRKDFEHQYSLLTSEQLDRESTAQYNVTIYAFDLGSPSFSQHTSFSITLADVNDNPPHFDRSYYEAILEENNPIGAVLLTVSAADADKDQNSRLSYTVLASPGRQRVEDPTSYISINPTSGQVYAERPFDYEQINHFRFQVEACDGGSPPLCNRIMAHIYLLDQNDNAPWIRFPFTGKDSLVQFRIPRSTSANTLVTKIMAVDLDSGRNAWLSYHLEQATDPSLFSTALRNGEVRTTRALHDLDNPTQELVLVVRDSGEPSMSTSVTVMVLLEESAPEAFLGLTAHSVESEAPPMVTVYLIISLAAISTISLMALVALGVRCFRPGACAPPSAFGCCRSKAGVLQDPLDPMLDHCHYQLSPGDATIGVQVACLGPPARGYRSCFSPVSDISEFVFMKPNLTLSTAAAASPEDQGPEPGCFSKVSLFPPRALLGGGASSLWPRARAGRGRGGCGVAPLCPLPRGGGGGAPASPPPRLLPALFPPLQMPPAARPARAPGEPSPPPPGGAVAGGRGGLRGAGGASE